MASRLYTSVLGRDWSRVSPGVARLHGRAGAIQRGRFRVRRGESWLARLIAALLRFPPEGDLVPLTLEITDIAGRERWRRVFERTPMVTEQWNDGSGALVESLGPLALHFRLEIEDGALVFRLLDARVFGFALPHRLRPRVSGREWGADRTQVAIRAEAPGLGFLLSYEGELE